MIRPYPSRAAAQAAIEAAAKSGRIDTGNPQSPNGTHWHAHVRKGTITFCL